MPPHTPTRPNFGLLAQFWRYSARYAMGLLLLAIYQTAQYWFDIKLRAATNAAVAGQSQVAVEAGVTLIGMAVAAFAVRVSSRVAVFNAGRHAEYHLRKALLEHLQKLGPSFYSRISAGDVMSRVTNDLAQVRLLLGFGVLNVMNTVFALVSSLAVTLAISVKLTFAALSTVPLLLLVMRHYSRSIFTRTRENQQSIGKLSEAVQTSIAGVRVVRSFALEERELQRFERANQGYLDKNLSLARLRGALGPLIYAITSAGFLVVFWYGGQLLLSGEIDEGGLLAFLRALQRLTWPIVSLGFVVSIVQRGRAGYSRLLELYSANPDVEDGHRPAPATFGGHLEVRNLTFAYRENPVLKDVSFQLEPGRSLAIVGRTGSGKSSLAVLLARLQPTPPQTVFLDGVDVCELPLAFVRGTVGYAEQTAFLFSTTVGRNIGFSLADPDSPASLQAIHQAAEEARVKDEILSLPDSFDTVVGERGVQLSGGQRQRTALARAFVGQPRILVLDDPLSAVDASTEARILEAIDRQRTERSVILITHRVAAAARCDRILVLDEGRVIEQGSHTELLALGGLYSSFAEEQRIESELERLAREGDLSLPPRASLAPKSGNPSSRTDLEPAL